jgi:hypothetical protein
MAKLVQNRLVIIILSLFLYTPCAYAQYYDESDRVFYGGLVAGTNFTQVDGDNFAGYHKAGWNAGVVVYARLIDRLALSMELLYAQKGARASLSQLPKRANDQSTIMTDYKIKLNYLEVPVLFNYFDKRKSNFGAGLSYAQLASSKESYRDDFGNIYEQDAKLYPFRKFDVNFILNGNAHIWKGLFFNLRFQYSLFSVRNAHNYLTGRAEQFNNIWCTRLMYTF